ncbi:hypothetical protein ACJX0J_032711, partial [Zea mays]
VIYLIMFSSDCFLLNVKIAKFHYLAVVLANLSYAHIFFSLKNKESSALL